MFDLTVATSDGRVVQRVELDAARAIRVGRATDCDIRVSDPQVSRHHVEIKPMGDGAWLIRDLGSTHGSFVKGQRFRELTVSGGLEVKIGPATLRFESMLERIGAELNDLIPDDDEA